ncbi:hypothetical protein SETIT_8G095200v2 [Setaria italica]|nr:hypothetical protein SETIT_8G095200v2 [Setaria italica]
MEAVPRNEASSAPVLVTAHRTGDRKAAVTVSNSSVTVAPRAAAGAGADHHRRARGGRVPALTSPLPRGSCSCKVEASAHGPGEGGDDSGGGAAVLMLARRNGAASRRLMPCLVSCVV